MQRADSEEQVDQARAESDVPAMTTPPSPNLIAPTEASQVSFTPPDTSSSNSSLSDEISAHQANTKTHVSAPRSLLEERPSYIVDKIIGRMHGVKNHMAEFEAYVQTQKDDDKPLYQWAKYKGYYATSRAISELDEAAMQFLPVEVPREELRVYLRAATQLSLSVSKVVVFAMGVMGEKFDTCIEEIEESDLSAEDNANAKTLITMELKKLVKHCMRATGRMYAALDLLRESLTTSEGNSASEVSLIKNFISENKEARKRTSRNKNWPWSVVGFLLGAALAAATLMIAAHVYGSASFDLAPKSNGHDNGMYAQVLDLVQRTQAVTNLTGEIYSIKLHDIDHRYQELAALADAHGLRIDNLVESLGPTNKEGIYYSAMPGPEPEHKVPDAVHQRIDTLSDNTGRQMQRLRGEMEQMRKNVNRMDLRLTKRLDKVDRTG